MDALGPEDSSCSGARTRARGAKQTTHRTAHKTLACAPQEEVAHGGNGGGRQAGRQRSRRAAAAAAAGPLGVSLIWVLLLLLCAILTCREGESARGPPPPRPGARPITRPQSPHHSALHTTPHRPLPLPSPSPQHTAPGCCCCCWSGCNRVAVGHVPLHPPWSCGDGPPGCGSWAGGWPLLRPIHACRHHQQHRRAVPPPLPPSSCAWRQAARTELTTRDLPHNPRRGPGPVVRKSSVLSPSPLLTDALSLQDRRAADRHVERKPAPKYRVPLAPQWPMEPLLSLFISACMPRLRLNSTRTTPPNRCCSSGLREPSIFALQTCSLCMKKKRRTEWRRAKVMLLTNPEPCFLCLCGTCRRPAAPLLDTSAAPS